MAARLIRILATCTLAVMLAPASAVADGDPASDFLLAVNVFYSYDPTVSAGLRRTLNAEAAAAGRAHFPIKVALIASPADLGVASNLFGHPQKYADFLDQEISYQAKQPLLVVMPSGYGVQGLTPPATVAAGSLTKPTGSNGDELARAAITAVRTLAAAEGHPINRDAASAGTSNGSTTLIVMILGLGAIGTAAALIAIRKRRAPPR